MSDQDRGTRWVVSQFAVIAAIAAGWLVGPHVPVLRLPGLVLAVAGAAVAIWAARTMGGALTPFPRPRADAGLVETGPFRYVRHPIYAGGIVFMAGASLGTGLAGLIGTVVLAVLWWHKAAFEERLLEQRFPGYAAYRERVPGRLVPRGASE